MLFNRTVAAIATPAALNRSTLNRSTLNGLTLTGALTHNPVKIIGCTAYPDLNSKPLPYNSKDSHSIIGDYPTKPGESDFESFLRAEYSWQSARNSNLNQNPADMSRSVAPRRWLSETQFRTRRLAQP